MLSRFIKKLFGNETKVQPQKKSPTLAEFLTEEINNTTYIKPDQHEVVLKALLAGEQLQTGKVLTADEKRELGINTRFKVHEGQVQSLTHDGLAFGPLNVLSIIQLRAEGRLARINQVRQLKEAGFKAFQMLSPADDRECDWCKKQNEIELPIDTDIDKLYQRNCTCVYCRCVAVADTDHL